MAQTTTVVLDGVASLVRTNGDSPRPHTRPHAQLLTNACARHVIVCCRFFGFWHSFCNFFAEITCFADRRFYGDWWNATSYSEFYQKWSLPVHRWLLVHVYFEMYDSRLWWCICKEVTDSDRGRSTSSRSLRAKKMVTMLLVVLFGAVCHELLLSVWFKVLAPYNFLLMSILGTTASCSRSSAWHRRH